MQATSYNVGLGGSNFNTEIVMYKNDTTNVSTVVQMSDYYCLF